MLADDTRLARVETAEVEEPQRKIVDPDVAFIACNLSRGQIPVGDVVAVVPQNADAVEEARDEVDVALVDEEAVLRVDDAALAQAILPPTKKPPRRVTRGKSDESEVVRASE